MIHLASTWISLSTQSGMHDGLKKLIVIIKRVHFIHETRFKGSISHPL
uniref:Uncharacterized protein n=1 Tax=Rhizophora mucronata TaxID=61149 RepID=A0A2P2QJ99_RHIMU